MKAMFAVVHLVVSPPVFETGVIPQALVRSICVPACDYEGHLLMAGPLVYLSQVLKCVVCIGKEAREVNPCSQLLRAGKKNCLFCMNVIPTIEHDFNIV